MDKGKWLRGMANGEWVKGMESALVLGENAAPRLAANLRRDLLPSSLAEATGRNISLAYLVPVDRLRCSSLDEAALRLSGTTAPSANPWVPSPAQVAADRNVPTDGITAWSEADNGWTGNASGASSTLS